ncbi:MAG: hypothetical protein H6738_24235 [Alphaproteobacteria bacterium]|nr:hypothetical protein [Alphaproteobacteria bacterium]
MLALVLAGVTGACREDCEPVVVGATASERSFVESTVDTFVGLLDPSLSLCVPKIHVTDSLRLDVAGKYNTATRDVKLVRSSSPDLKWTLHHELCHAVQGQNGLPVDGPQWSVAPDIELLAANKRFPEKEAYAMACEIGPDIAFLLGDPCPTDQDGLSAFFDAREIFVGPDPAMIDLSLPVAFTPTVALGSEVTDFSVSVAPSGVLVDMDGATAVIDPWTGALVEAEGPFGSTGPFVVEGDEMMLGLTFDAPNGDRGVRLVLSSGGRYTPLGCYEPGESLFSYDGVFWSASLTGGQVVLGYYTVGVDGDQGR